MDSRQVKHIKALVDYTNNLKSKINLYKHSPGEIDEYTEEMSAATNRGISIMENVINDVFYNEIAKIVSTEYKNTDYVRRYTDTDDDV